MFPIVLVSVFPVCPLPSLPFLKSLTPLRLVYMFWSDNLVLTLCLLLLPCLIDDCTEPAVPAESACGSRPFYKASVTESLKNISSSEIISN